MADNAALRAAHRAAADRGRRAAEAVGARPTKVTVRVRTYTAPVGTSTATVSSTTNTPVDPRPRVRQLSQTEASFYGGGLLAAGTGRSVAAYYAVGPMTLDYAAGGYTVADLLPAGATTKRVTIVLEGDEFTSGGEEMHVVNVDATRPHQVNLVVSRTRQGT